MERTRLSMHWTGKCRHPECTTRRGGGLRPIDFPMFAGVIERAGELCAFDPGYAPRFVSATERFPERLYRWATPAECPPESTLAAQLKAANRFEAVSRAIVSHFHADHVAGLLDFPDVEIVCSRRAWDDLTRRTGFGAVRRGYLRALTPEALVPRIRFMEDLPRCEPPAALRGLEAAFDLHGDGSVRLIPLPGHAAGQIGAWMQSEDGRDRLLIADAAWSIEALEQNRPPPWLVRAFMGAPREYMRTWDSLRAASSSEPELRLIPSHCAVAATREGTAPA